MTVALIESRIDTDRACRAADVRSRDFDVWDMPDMPGGIHQIHAFHVWTRRGFIGKGDTFTAALDDVMSQIRAALPTTDHQEQQ